ncbi:aspartate/glutamate racemase family protein [Psychromarinibacter halotolerans]|uniref:Aspartate/glutamate racemase family protein n=1 Tax=Psychromarinibacter halotolerans TaxID=1775175 RepID=A0ABV7GX64_9RHOB|nr:aspartate/glutamate racemase family protein [Psychromarinibacter halotolerans]MDF0597945.1 aspartate/glutamate racemase family protein [Psychromarinibacter halotolerans]
MRLLYINPNSTAEMTDSIVEAARAAVPEAEVIGWTNTDGPPAIQGAADGDAAVPGLLALLPKARTADVDAIVIACFDDTGLDGARAMAHCPVLGIGQAGFHMAVLMGGRFGVVTTLPISVPVIEGNIASYGFADACTGVRPSGLPVLAVEEGGDDVLATLDREITAAAADGARSVVLGCAGMARHRSALSRPGGPLLIDGVAASALLAVAAHGYVGARSAA